MERYAPTTKDLASRDVVSRAMTVEVREGRGCGPSRDHILLHLEHLEPGLLEERLPGISETARVFAGVDVSRTPIPVQPTAHYNMGGIPTNLHGEALSPDADDPDRVVPGLMAVGEAASVSVHGANRLGTNSLLDLVVFGRAAALRARELVQPDSGHPPLPKDAAEPAIERFERIRNAAGKEGAGTLRAEMQRTMQRHCSVFRLGSDLEAGIGKLERVAGGMAELGIGDHGRVWNTDLIEALELDNLMAQASVVLRSALNRTESRGAHAREDFPRRDDVQWLQHSLAWRESDGRVTLGSRPVRLHPLSNEVQPFPPAERVY
jgi:succinate dehydrogenase / fumarate reductase flavoprotein subunit